MDLKHFTESQAKAIGDQIGIDWTKTDLQEFIIGLEIELEHGFQDPATDVTGNDPVLTGKIALAHINEFPDYYTRLLACFGKDEKENGEKVTIVAEINVLDGYHDELYGAAKEVWQATLKEDGCETFSFNINKENGLKIVFLEVFKSQESFDYHVNADHTKKFLEFLKGRVENDQPKLLFLDQVNH
ncbi:Quinol monooxygenase YgiN [Chryseobacterium arachidis]|uniref:Quinol monooxygenase YgiN n=1 Tax=Chryseobacterium arachidis TaxID=1416778 RepID=A0A1M5MFL2_9FLAO|nr:DUF5661 family protein [Chryseobacterium arachidis]SHG75659.1 Quinol monooxygenase YgiN [Chryseobacterium arachidis]